MKRSLLLCCALSISTVCYAGECGKSKEKSKSEAPKGQSGIVLRSEQEGMPELSISGVATVSLNHTSGDVEYYDGKNQPDQIKSDQKSTAESSKDSSKIRLVGGCTDIAFAAKGTLPNDWIYGAVIALDAERGNTGVDKMYIYTERDNVGTFQAGNVRGADALFIYDGQRLMGGLCGADGSYPYDLDYATGVISPCYVIGFSNKATKVSYFTPTVRGFQAGVSVTPDTKHIGTTAKDSGSGDTAQGNDAGLFVKGDQDKERPSGRNSIAFGLGHTWDFNNGWKSAFGAVYVMEDSRPVETNCYVGDVIAEKAAVPGSAPEVRKIKIRNARAFHLSGTVTYKDWSIAAGYINNGKSRLPVDEAYTADGGASVIPGGFLVAKGGDAGSAWNIGTKYVFGQWTFASVFHRTARNVTSDQSAKGVIVSFSAEYQVCPGFKVFGEVDNIVTHTCDYACAVYNLVHEKKEAIKKQRAFFVAVGAKVTF